MDQTMKLYEFRRTIFLGVLFIGFLLLVYFVGLPFLITRSISLITPEMEARLGEMAYEEYTAGRKINHDPDIAAVLEKCAETVQTFDTTYHIPLKIVVIEDTVKNAFALPGGYILLHRGILDLLEDESELNGLLAHEAGHIYLRHGLRQLARKIYISLFLTVVTGSDNGYSDVLFSHSALLLSLSNSRSQEEAADDFAIRALQEANLNPRGLSSLFEKFRAAEEKRDIPPVFLSTHPATAERIARIEKQLPDSGGFQILLTEEEWNTLASYEFAEVDDFGSYKFDLRSLETLPEKAAALRKMGQYNDALQLVEAAIRMDSTDPAAYYERAILYYEVEEYQKALDDFEQVLVFDPFSKWAYAYKGYSLHYLGRNEEALTAFTKAIELDNRFSWAYNGRGHLRYRNRDYERALADFDKAIEITPDNKWAYTGKGSVLRALKRGNEAVNALQKAVRIDPQYAFAYNQLGFTYMDLKSYDESIAAFKKSIEINPLFTNSYGNMGWAYYLKGDFGNCIKYSEKAVGLDSTALYARYNIALSYLRLGEIEKSKELYIKTRQYNLSLNQEIDPGTIQDLKDLIDKNIMAAEARMILSEIFEQYEAEILSPNK